MKLVAAVLGVVIGFSLAPVAHAEHDTMAGLTSSLTGGTFEAQFKRQTVSYDSAEPAGTIIIVTGKRFLYYVLGGGKALRYGIGVGRDGFTWSGIERISRKAEWPDWHPPPEMVERDENARKWKDGMPGGPDNPLGARALYLGASDYRIHGTAQPSTIGHAVSSGCIRLTNNDVIDLYGRAKIGTKVIVK